MNKIKLTTSQTKKVNSFKYTSTKVRYLLSLKHTPSQVSKYLNIIYQHVNNIIHTNVKSPKETF